jgi:hypothetical protein
MPNRIEGRREMPDE